MEGSAYVDATIDLYERLRAAQPQTGICLQAYLRRTAADIERLLPARPGDPPGQGRLRRAGSRSPTATGAASTRTTSALAVRFLLDGRGRPIRLGLGTHDVGLIEQIAEQVGAAGIGRDAFEVEMLYGIRTGEQFRLAQGGLPRPDAHRVR